MTTRVVVPTLGESVLEATVSQWLKKEGDFVRPGEVLVELETDKVNVEVGAERAGILSRIEKKEGEDVNVGDLLATIEEEKAGVAEPAGPDTQEKASEQDESQEKEKGAVPPAESTNLRGTADSAEGPVEKTKVKQDGNEKERAAEIAEGRKAGSEQETELAATPVARRMAKELGLDLAVISSREPGGRVTKEAIEAYLSQANGEREEIKEAPVSAQERTEPVREAAASQRPTEGVRRPVSEQPPEPTRDGLRETRVRMSRRRRTIAQRLVEAQRTAAILTTFNEIDMSAVMDLRKRRNEEFQKRYGVKLGFTSFFVKASIGALKAFPTINAEIQGDEIVLKHYYDIGIAVGAEEGLVVPVLRDADRLSFAEIEKRVTEFVDKVQNGTLSIEDLRGGTFTITNGGVFGSLMSTPILNPPQVGILGMHKIEPRPVAIGDQVVIRPMMYVALSYDHRIVDGREAVQFLVRVKELIEDPETLLLEG